MDQGKRVQLIQQMQQLVYEQSPYIVYAYPEELQAFDTAHWQGWVREPAGSGTVDNHWTYLNVRPKAGAKTARSPVGIIAGVAAAVVIVVAAIIWLAVRRRSGNAAVEE
jgi:peptide/nickel transport system substrate-binding protein